MRILEYIGLEIAGLAKPYQKVTRAIAAGDFRQAQVKKLAQGKFYRARLDDTNRLLFTFVRHRDEVCALMLEVILNHDYAGSRFLRGAIIDEERIPDGDPAEAINQAQPLRYLNPNHTAIHLLDKPISFDEAQEAIYRQPAPLIIVGSAGSGKTALTLEKLKRAEGEVLYVTHSAFLARGARDMYFSNGFEHSGQDAVFLSYREFVETIQVPPGREASWRDFAAWFGRMKQAFKGIDAHQAFEEIRGVIAAQPDGVLSRQAYRTRGVRQSIFAEHERDAVYDLFEKYRAWLAQAGLFDLNLVAQETMPQARPRYDFVVIDEVQDITPVQLALVLKTLKKAGHFLLCGDSNQIVHPNFFSWAQVRNLFWNDTALAERQELRLLTANFRNGSEATRIANQLLKIKQRRFGSIDRESNYLVEAIGGDTGSVHLMPDKDTTKRELDAQTRQSTQFAVLVMRDEDKAEARKYFSTPLLFSIHEAKGLEYENIVLFRLISNHRAQFSEIVAGVGKSDLAGNQLDYRRAKDKGDKSLEVYKFFVNALYVALTRAIRNLYLIESDISHPLFGLLDLTEASQVRVEARQASLEDWQREARKLELQGKQEQAEAIRSQILRQTPVPWPVFDQARTHDLLIKVFREQTPGGKLRQQLYDIATCQNLERFSHWLVTEAKFEAARAFHTQQPTQSRKTYVNYFAQNFKDILRQCERHGLEHRLPMNITPLMAAAAAGNVRLVEALIERGADLEAVDHFGLNALHWSMTQAFQCPKFANGPFAAMFELLAPPFVDVKTGDRLVRIDCHLSEYFLFQTMWALFRSRFTQPQRRNLGAFESQAILNAWQHIPKSVLRPERNKRQHLSGVLARNEVERDYAWNRALFIRVTQGWYQLNPKLSVRRTIDGNPTWVPVLTSLNLPFINEFAVEGVWCRIDHYLRLAGLPESTPPIVAERVLAEQAQADRVKAQREKARAEALANTLRAQDAGQSAPPKWGTPAAIQAEIDRLRTEIEARRKGNG